jgi:hypothetical protein
MSRTAQADHEFDRLIDEITIDCYDEDDALSAFENAFDEDANFSLPGSAIGEDVEVLSVGQSSCRRDCSPPANTPAPPSARPARRRHRRRPNRRTPARRLPPLAQLGQHHSHHLSSRHESSKRRGALNDGVPRKRRCRRRPRQRMRVAKRLHAHLISMRHSPKIPAYDAPNEAPNEAPNKASNAFAQPAETIRGVFEPPGGFVLSAISRNKLIVLVAAVIFALIGLGVGNARRSTYTASATLQVGQVNPNSPGFLGYVESSASLATAFSRAITAAPVLATIQDKLNLVPAKAIPRLSAEPLPQSPAFRVLATGPTEYAAVQLANVAADAVITYEVHSNSANPETTSLLADYRHASIHLHHATNTVEHLTRGLRTRKSALAGAEAERNATALELRAIEVAYTNAVTSEAPRSGLVTLLAGATSASSNSRSKIELFGFIGLLGGGIIGCGAAALCERRRISRGAQARMPRPESP